MGYMNFIGYGYRGSFIMFGIASIVYIALVRSFLRYINNPGYNRILSILKQRYAKNEISPDDYSLVNCNGWGFAPLYTLF